MPRARMDKLALTCLLAAVCALASCALNPQPEPPGSNDIAPPRSTGGSGGAMGGVISGTSGTGGNLTGGRGGAGGLTGAAGACGFCDAAAPTADASAADAGPLDTGREAAQTFDAPPSTDGVLDDAAPDTGTTVEGGDSNPTETGANETGPLGDGPEGDGGASPE